MRPKTKLSKDKGCDVEVWSMGSGAKQTLVQILPRPLTVMVLGKQLSITVHRGNISTILPRAAVRIK